VAPQQLAGQPPRPIQILAHFSFQLDEGFHIVLQELACILPTLADALAL